MASEDKFLDGFKRFKEDYFGNDVKLYNRMINNQPAKTMMIACCDSRVDPAILTDCDLGDLFTIRNLANLVPLCERAGHLQGISAALEFAVNELKVENIIIMGHSDCGGIKVLWNNYGMVQSRYIDDWVSIAQPAKERVQKNFSSSSSRIQIKECEQQAILVSLNNLLTFPYIKKGVENGLLHLHGWYFDIAEVELLSYNFSAVKFETIDSG
ncbi:MAG: carbonic anhydrase [Piscirickettsiaceae bacterium]|nr:carbonic anhydrase [Piscirickettsiaceae bacterium]